MSFGFGVGDFIAVGGLALRIADALRGSQSEYQELIRELENLQRALSQVDKLKGRGDQAIAVDQIKCAALTCRYPLEDFLAKIQKYDKALGLGKSDGKVKPIARKVQYAFTRKSDANTLRNYLNIHIGTINMLLLRQGLEMLDVASEERGKEQDELRDRIEDSSRELREVRGNTEAQTLAVRENNSMLRKLFWMVSGDIAAPLRSLAQAVANVCVSTQQIYTTVLELRTSLTGIDTRFTFFQEPVKVEDVLGRVFPFSSECSIEALNAEIKARFKQGPGRIEVMAGDFEIFDAKNSDHVLTTSDPNGLLPGMSINMAIVLEKEFESKDQCPMPRCYSTTFVRAIGGGRTCSECNVWFDQRSAKRKRDVEEERISEHVEALADHDLDIFYPEFPGALIVPNREIIAITQPSSSEKSISAFKRIRLHQDLQALAIIKRIAQRQDLEGHWQPQLREFLRQMKLEWPERSKWASESRIGQQELYEVAEFVLVRLIAMTDSSGPFLSPLSEREGPGYHGTTIHAMDLSTMYKELNAFKYTSKNHFVDDLYKVWTNSVHEETFSDPHLRIRTFLRKASDGLVQLIPDIVVRRRAEVEAEERRQANIYLDSGDSDDDEPIMSSRGRMSASMYGGGLTPGVNQPQTQTGGFIEPDFERIRAQRIEDLRRMMDDDDSDA